MRKPELMARATAAAAGVAMLVGVAGAAFAQANSTDVDVSVEIDALTDGVLAMTVDGSSANLAEEGSTATVRQFVGQLPTVTITDTRNPDDIPDGAFWYVVGSATEFTGESGQAPIGAQYLGWTPELIDGGDSGLVAEGDEVDGELDGGPGLVDQELLAMAFDSSHIAPEGSWTATADLTLRVPATVTPGAYTSVLTLSLFE
jgi:hypothetical protein